MKTSFNKILVALGLCMAPALTVLASSHREAPLIAYDPQADNTDVYAFRSPKDTNKVIIIANYIPFELPQGGPNYYSFGTDIRYEIHIKNSTATTADDITYRFTFNTVNDDTTTFFNIRLGKINQKNTYTLQRSIGGAGFITIVSNGMVPPANIGPRSIDGPVGLGVGSYDSVMRRAITTASSGERVFAGPIDDPFFVDLGGAFDLGGFRNPGATDPKIDGLEKYNVHTLVLEIPITTLQKNNQPVTAAANILDPNFVIGVWASASRLSLTTLSTTGAQPAGSGTWVQVSRLGMPLTNEVITPIGQKDLWNSITSGSAGESQFMSNFNNPELGLYVDSSSNGYGAAVPGLNNYLRIQSRSRPNGSLGPFDFRNGKKGLYGLKGNPALAGTAFDPTTYGNLLLPDSMSPRSVDIMPIFLTGVPNLAPYQLAVMKTGGNPLSAGKPFINNFLPVVGDMLRLNMAVPVTPRTVNGSPNPAFSSLGIVSAAVSGLTNSTYNTSQAMQFIPNMDGFPNGRRLEDDVTTIELQAIGGVALAAIGLWYDDYNPATSPSPVTAQLLSTVGFNAGVAKNDTTFKDDFPFVQQPWRGYNGAQYIGPSTPVFTGIPSGDSLVIASCASQMLTIQATDADPGQTVTITASSTLPCGFSYSAVNGTTSTATINIQASPCNVGNYTITVTATDNGALPGVTLRTIYIRITPDVTPPVFSNCPANITVAGSNNCGAIVNYTPPTASDNCATCSIPASLPSSYTLIGTFGGHTYYFDQAYDLWPNHNTRATNAGGHLVTITSGAENAYVSAALNNGAAFIGFNDVATEGTFRWTNGETVSYTNWCAGEPNGGTNENYGLLTSNPGNCWVDVGPFTYRPAIVEYDCSGGGGVTAVLTAGPSSGSTFPVGTTTVTYTTTDAASNTATCSFTVTVTDNTRPTIVGCPRDTNLTTSAANPCGANYTYTAPTATDNCSSCPTIPSMPNASLIGTFGGHTYYLATNYNTWAGHNATATAAGGHLITINSAAENAFASTGLNNGAALIGANDQAVEGTFVWANGEPFVYSNWCAGEPNGGRNENYGLLTSNPGNCWVDISGSYYGFAIYEFDCATNNTVPVARTSGPASGSSFPIGMTTVVYVATDASGNKDTCRFRVTVSDPANRCANPLVRIGGEGANAEFRVSAYPNPFAGGMHLRFESSSFREADVIIHDITGRSIETRLAQPVGKDIVIGEGLSAGVYMVEVRHGDASQKVRIVKIQ